LIKSMTGYGSGSSESIDYTLSLEIRAVNGRFFEAKVRLPRSASSFEHFVNTLINKNYYQSGYEIRAEMRKSSEEVVQDSSTSADINANFHQQKNISGGARYLSRDTIAVANIFSRIDDNTYELRFINFLNVTYLDEYETFEYRKWQQGVFAERNPDLKLPQNSVMTLTTDSLRIHKSGYIYNPTDYMVGGYWAFERLSDLLPINYEPGE